MEKYKKKSLHFMGFSRELRKTERENRRCVSRHQRFSIIRKLENESMIEEKNENTNSRIPTIGMHKDQVSSRVEMLQKWKQEKIVKKQQESKLKKPVFKVGVIKPNPPPSLGNKPLFALDASSRLFKSSFQVSNSQLSSKKQESLNASTTKINAKVSNSQTSAKKPEVNAKINTKDMKTQSSTSKMVVPSKPESKWTGNKESGIQLPSMKTKVDTKSRVVNKDQASIIKKQPLIGSKPSVETKKESRLQPLNVKSKVTSLARDAKSNIPSSSLPKATASRTLSTKPKQIPSSGLPKAIASRTLSTEPKQATPKKNNALKSIPNCSKTVSSQQKGNISEKTSRSESGVPIKSKIDYLTNKPNKLATFKCEISQIEPAKEQRKSFAPPGFVFQPPVELNSSLFLEDGPSAIFMRMKNQFLRTSTPKQSPSNQKSSIETKESKCLENEDMKCEKDETIQCLKDKKNDEDMKCEKDETIQCLKDKKNDEDSQCSKNAVNKLESSHKSDLEGLLSSSLESVYLNDVKPFECKQYLTFEVPEIISTQNHDDMPLSSKITHPELSLAREPTLGRAFNLSILPDLDEIDKTETNSIDTRLDDKKIAIPFHEVDSFLSEIIPDQKCSLKPIDCKQSLNSEFSEIVSAPNLEEVLFSPNIMDSKHSLASEPTSDATVYSSILPNSVEIDKTEINSTNLEGDNKLTVPVPEVDSAFSDVLPNTAFVKPDKNTEKNRNVLNCFLQKREISFQKISEKKIRNFRRGEKLGLSSIDESLENTPKSDLKRKDLESISTVRRSLRLAKLSGNFSSLENLVDTPRSKESEGLKGDFTPRRSLRLSKFCTEFNSAENLFDVRRPTLYGTPEKDGAVPKLNSKVTYDFDKLSLETEDEIHLQNGHGRKVSLLYTPSKSRPSIMRHSIKGDLMSFSPNA